MSLKTITTTDFRNNMSEALSTIEGTKNPLIVKYKGKEVFVVVDIDVYEDILDSYDPALKKQIKKGREEYKKGKYKTFEDVFGNIK